MRGSAPYAVLPGGAVIGPFRGWLVPGRFRPLTSMMILITAPAASSAGHASMASDMRIRTIASSGLYTPRLRYCIRTNVASAMVAPAIISTSLTVLMISRKSMGARYLVLRHCCAAGAGDRPAGCAVADGGAVHGVAAG